MNPQPTALVLPIAGDADMVAIRQAVREAAVRTGMSLVEQTKLITAASELARNTLLHGGGGRVEIGEVHEGGRRGVELSFTDRGPGITDVPEALADGFSTGNGLGMGLGGTRRLVDDFRIDSAPGEGTTVAVRLWAGRAAGRGPGLR